MNQTEANQIQTERMQQLAALITIGLRALSTQALTVFALVLDAAIFGWAISTESPIRLGGAVLFAIAAWSLLYLRPKGDQK